MPGTPENARSPREPVREHEHRYAPDAERPLGGHLAVLSSFGTGVAGAALAPRPAGRRAPQDLGPRERVLLTLATHKLSRMPAEDTVTGPLRAPFTRYEGTSAYAGAAEEVRDERGSGLRHAVGELPTCPSRLAPWAASALLVLRAASPATARTCFSGLLAGSDFRQSAYAAAQQRHAPGD